MMKARHLLSLLLLLCGTASLPARKAINLSGMWQLALGEQPDYTDRILLPGSLITNGKGDEVTAQTVWTGSTYDSSYYFNPFMKRYRERGNVKFPFFLTPDRHYVGKAWYRRTVRVPKSWKGRRIVLFLERPHIETRVYVNGAEAGHQTSLSTPHQYDVTDLVLAGRINEIVICVYNGIEHVGVGRDSHSVTDQTQGNWNGVAGRLELRSWRQPAIRITHDSARRMACIHVDDSSYFVPLGDSVRLWSEFDPYLYSRTVMHQGQQLTVTFGLRDIAIRDRQLLLNGKPIWLRGTVENCCFPQTGYPPTDEASWMRIFRKLKAYGLNHVRFHSYCPPEAAFAAADKLGLYLQPEGPTWPNHGVALGRGQAIDQYLLEESRRIIDAYGHHPSFVMMAAGNEPAGNWVPYCNNWVRQMKEYDPTKIYCGASVGGGWAWDDGSEFHVRGGARGLDWDSSAPHSDDDYSAQIDFPRNYRGSEPNRAPFISHEQGQWCAFPDLSETAQYTGAYKARNFEIFRDLLRENGMESQARRFLMSSGRLQALAYKYEIERNLRTSGYAGFQLLALNDYSGQGTALVGVLNVHWREKGYASAASWTQFCASVVPLALFPRFVYTDADTLVVPIRVYNASAGPLAPARTAYAILDSDGKEVVSGLLSESSIPLGKDNPVGTVRFPLHGITQPGKLTLQVRIGRRISNSWEFWVYPRLADNSEAEADGIHITDSLDNRALQVLSGGGRVLLTAAGRIKLGSDVVQHYLPVFWNTSWFKMRPPHTTGAYIDTSHPLFRYGFPTDDWGNLNWWELLNRAQVMNLAGLPASYQPPIQPIDTWHLSRKLGMLVEANVLGGRLLITTMDISSHLDDRPVAKQMRRTILRYMASSDFSPALTLSPGIIADLYSREAPPAGMFTNDSPDELKTKGE